MHYQCVLKSHLLSESMVSVQTRESKWGVFLGPFLLLVVTAAKDFGFGKSCILLHSCMWNPGNVSEAAMSTEAALKCSYRQVVHFTFVPDLRLQLFFPLKSVKATHLPRHQVPYGLGKTMKCISEWIKFMVYSKMLIFHYSAAWWT